LRAWLIACAVLALGEIARADGMDPSPERLVLQPPGLAPGQTCQSIAANPEIAVAAGLNPNDLACRPDNVAFRNLISDLGFAIAPNGFHPAHTTGYGGFALTFETSLSKVNADASSLASDGTMTKYWQQGTRGAIDPATKSYPPTNKNPDSILGVYSLKARKGLPFGFELMGQLGWVGSTSLWVLGADLRWSPFEGFRTGPLGVVPDIAVGGGVRTLTGTSKFSLTVVGVDAQISKPIPIANQTTITPYVGYQRLYIFGDASVMDATPNVDALNQCGFQGNDPVTGGPICNHKLSNGFDNNSDFNNNFVFDNVRTHRHRMMFGVAWKYEFVYAATQFLFDLLAANEENPGLVNGRQWTYSLEAGVWF
jgi:hypothetical protein